jgi:hypothetical protein
MSPLNRLFESHRVDTQHGNPEHVARATVLCGLAKFGTNAVAFDCL